jgi:hypothetical protein
MTKRSNRSLFVLSLAVMGGALLAAVPASAADNSLKDLMKKMGAASASGDAKALAPLLAKTKSMGKPEFANWASMSDQGKAAAEGGDLAGAKATCKSCHDAYRAEYKTKYGSKAP